ncbi:MAG: 2-hydroxychromene-2-carboxylate isomerase [Candidatus Fonsibacter sp.]
MSKILYYYSVMSPWSYLGLPRLLNIASKFNLEIEEKPIDLVGKVFPSTGGVAVPQRHISRQNYRLLELKRWGEFLKININIKPKFFPVKDPHTPALFCIASISLGRKIDFGFKLLENLWSLEKDISELEILKTISNNLQLDFNKLKELASSDKIKKIYEDNSSQAIHDEIFGVPMYIFKGEKFWGQDRLELLEYKIKNS